jgi:hypothetical protein
MVPQDLRIRLEGAVEALEAAREDFESLEASLPRWEDELPLQRTRLEARLSGDDALEQALAKCGAVDGLGSLVEEVRRRRAHVGELARRELAAVAPADAPGVQLEALERLRTLALAPVEPVGEVPLATLTTTARAPWPLMLLVVAAMASLWWNAAVGVTAICLALILSSGFRRVTKYELFADRVVVKPNGLRGFSVPLASVTAIGPAPEPVHLVVEGTRRLVLPEKESLGFVQRVAIRRLACLQGVRAAPGTGAVMLMTLFGVDPGPGALLIAPTGALFLGQRAGRAAVEALDGRPLGVEVPVAALALELSRLDEAKLTEVLARLATVPGCLAMPLSNLWCDPPDTQGMVTFHLGAKDGHFLLEPARAKRVEAWLRPG